MSDETETAEHHTVDGALYLCHADDHYCPATEREAAGETAEDRERRYLVPVARLNLAGQPDLIHLSVYQWLPEFQGWGTRTAICGAPTQPGPLMKATVTCPGCEQYRPRYERMLAPGYRPEDDDPDVLRAQLAAARAEIAELRRERDVLRRARARQAATSFPDTSPNSSGGN